MSVFFVVNTTLEDPTEEDNELIRNEIKQAIIDAKKGDIGIALVSKDYHVTPIHIEDVE